MEPEKLTSYRTCPLCEATCGLEISHTDGKVERIRGDREDVFSRGYICPKGTTLGRIQSDPDRLRRPLVRNGDGHREAAWSDAFSIIDERLTSIIEEHGPNAVGVYLGNPTVHSMAGVLYNRAFLRMLRTRNIFSAATVDQMPKHVSSGYMFGHPDLIPVPDIDRTDYLLMLGANPLESNGSLATAPDWPGRMERIRARGGRIVVVDPRHTRTAAASDLHVPIVPGTDAMLLAAIANTLFETDQVDLGDLVGNVDGLDRLAQGVIEFTPEAVEKATGVPSSTTRTIATDLAKAESAVVYGRIGTHTARFGTLASWIVDALNLITGNLDRPGGAMFPLAAHERPRKRRQFQVGRWTSRVSGIPEARGELPVSAMAEEILEPGEGQIRALVTIAGNPVLSTPDSDRLVAALDSLEFMVSIDLYLNETSRHADVVLAGTPPLNRSHYDFAFNQLAVRNVANYSPPVFPLPEDTPDETEILLRLAAIVSGQGADADVDDLDDALFATLLGSAVADATSPIYNSSPEEIFQKTRGKRAERMLDFMLRTGPYGDGFGERNDGLSLERLEQAPHGIDLGPLQPRLPAALCTPSGQIDAAPDSFVEDLARLRSAMASKRDREFLLVGRRDVRSNNSWMHNIEVLIRGRERCLLEMSPSDASRLGLEDGDMVKITSEAATVNAPVQVTPDIMDGVVSLPHGWGHDLAGTRLSVASTRPGVNKNRLTTGEVDPLSGNAVLNAIPVDINAV